MKDANWPVYCEKARSLPVPDPFVGQSIDTPLALIGPAHFLISLSTNARRYSDDLRSGEATLPPISLIRACTEGVSIVETAASWSFWTMLVGVSFGRKMAFQI